MSKLIFGCGYLGMRAAEAWRDAGQLVVAVTRSPERARHFADRGLSPMVADIADPQTLRDLPPAETVLFSVGFDRAGDQSIRDVYVDGLAHVLEALPPSVKRFIYISSTGVYGQSDGEWVDETSPCEPLRDSGRACLEAESLLAEHVIGEKRIVLRLAGIYGPGRLPQLSLVQEGKPIEVAPDGSLNLIHVDDAVGAVLRAEAVVMPPELLVISDGNPVARREFYETLAGLCSAPHPTFVTPAADSSRGGRARGDKRIRNAKMSELLALELKYRSYRDGLAAIVAESGH